MTDFLLAVIAVKLGLLLGLQNWRNRNSRSPIGRLIYRWEHRRYRD